MERFNKPFNEENYRQLSDYCREHDMLIEESKTEYYAAPRPEPTQDEILTRLRNIRDGDCFSIVNRGQVWYDTLTDEQKAELKKWYGEWLNVTETKEIPAKPSWLK